MNVSINLVRERKDEKRKKVTSQQDKLRDLIAKVDRLSDLVKLIHDRLSLAE